MAENYHSDFWPNFSFSLKPPGVDGVAAGVLLADCGAGERFGILSFGSGVEGVAPGDALVFDCLNVIRGPGGGIPVSSRLRFADVVSFEGARDVRKRPDWVKRMTPWTI